MGHRIFVVFNSPLEWMPYHFRLNRQWLALAAWYAGYSIFALFFGFIFISCCFIMSFMFSSLDWATWAILSGSILWVCYLHYAWLTKIAYLRDETRSTYLGALWTSRFGSMAIHYYVNRQWSKLILWYSVYSVITIALFGLFALCGEAISYGLQHASYEWFGWLVAVLLGVGFPVAIVARHIQSVFVMPQTETAERVPNEEWLDVSDPSDAEILASCARPNILDDDVSEVTTVHWSEYDGKFEDEPSRDVWLRMNPHARSTVGADGLHVILDKLGQRATCWVWHFISRSKLPADYSPTRFTEAGLAPIADESVSSDRSTWYRKSYPFNGGSIDLFKRTFFMQDRTIQEWVVARPENRRILRREERQYDLATGRLVSRVICSDYEYNISIDRDLFQMPWWKPTRLMPDEPTK